ncbi:MAG: two-component regulator propeller domain-containing protein, partial [Flavobacteriales bacterium]
EDASHNFWACSDDHGINRITLSDSTVEVRNFSVEDGLSKQVVFDAVIDKNGLMWLATFYSGIDIVSFENDSIRVKQLYEGFDIPSAMILNFEQDGTGNIWCGTYNAGAFKIELTDQPFEYNVMTFDDLDSGSVWDILVRSNGETWFGTGENGVLRIFPDQENNDRHLLEQYTVEEGLPINQILSLLEDAEGNVWLGTNGAGLCKFGGDVFSHYGEKEGLSNDNIMGLAMDNEANIWLATDGGGINKLSFLNGKPTVELLNKDDGMPSNFISCIDAGNSKNDNLWIGTSKSGIVKFNGKQFISYRETDGLKNNRVYSICVDDRGIVWIGTADGINLYDGIRFLGISMSDLKVSEDGVKAIIKDREGNIWFGTAGALARYGGDTSITTFDEEEGLATTDINCLESDGNSNIWIGTNGGGLYFFDTHTADSLPIRHVEGNEKLGTHTLYSLAMLNDSTLIAGATNGMYRISLDAAHNITHVRRYDRTNGFKGVECNENAIFKDPLGAVWIGTTSGLTKYNPAKDHLLLIPPVVHITGLDIFFKKVDWAAESDSVSAWSNLPINLELPFSRNHLTFFFTAISFTNPDKVQYRYMLDGLDADWSPPSSESKVTFSGLPFGEYTFKVMAVNADGIWTEEPTTYHFIILPPWYRTYWFYIVCVIFIALTFYIYIKVRERKLMKEKAVLERKVRERTAEVVKQKEEIEEKNKEITDSINYA